jgi:hypothetical protein
MIECVAGINTGAACAELLLIEIFHCRTMIRGAMLR